MSPKTLYDKLWDQHLVTPESTETPALIYIDLHLIHEVTSPQAFQVLRDRGLQVRRPDLTVATMDHSTPTLPPDAQGNWTYSDVQCAAQVEKLVQNCQDFGITLHPLGSQHQGIVHVIGPEMGLTQPGKTIVCGDSHTSTHGAFGALAFGIGTSEVGQVFATQCLLQRKAQTMAVEVSGQLARGVGAKDLILALIAKIGVGGGTGHVLEYRGQAIRHMNMDARMTVCNMSIEAGARAGMIAPDQTTYDYLEGRPHVPENWEAAVSKWDQLASDEGASFDTSVHLDAAALAPMITYGTDPAMAVAIDQPLPDHFPRALEYMQLQAGKPLLGQALDVVFIGSCTNSRMSDLREAARVLEGRKVAAGVRTLIVPGSRKIKQQAESEGLHTIFEAAGAEWREPGCSMCIAMNGDMLAPGQLAVSTSNRNFEGRQGKGSRTLLASPATAAACAVTGVVSDARQLEVDHASV